MQKWPKKALEFHNAIPLLYLRAETTSNKGQKQLILTRWSHSIPWSIHPSAFQSSRQWSGELSTRFTRPL